MTSTREWGLDNPEKVKDQVGRITRVVDIQPVLWWQTVDSNQPKVGDHIILYRAGAGDIKRCKVVSLEQYLCGTAAEQVLTAVVVEILSSQFDYSIAKDDLWLPDTLPKEQ